MAALTSLGDNTGGREPLSSDVPQYDVMDFTKSSEEHETDVYLTIPDHVLSPRYENAETRSDSAIKRTEFVYKLASMTDEDFRRQFKVIDDFFLLLKRWNSFGV